MKRHLKRLRNFVLLIAVVVLVPYLWSRGLSPSRCIRVRSHVADLEKPSTRPDSLRIASYNIAHGRGLPFDNWNGESKDVRRERLDAIADLIREMDADIVVLNEVDFEASWSHKVNQAEHIAKRAGYPYWVEERNLDFRIVNYTWRFGNAILSRYPVKQAKVVQLPSYENWETSMAGKKRAVFATFDLPTFQSQPIGIVGAHLSHRSEHVRNESAKMLCDLAAHAGMPVFVAGDLNSCPPDFPKSSITPNNENAITTFDASNLFQRQPTTMPTIPEMTFPSDSPAQVIDWVLVPTRFDVINYVVRDAKLSDHRPIYTDVRLKQDASAKMD